MNTTTPGRLVHYLSSLRPGGGPPGYLYNLKNSLPEDSNIVVFSAKQVNERKEKKAEHNRSSLFRSFIHLFKNLKRQIRPLPGKFSDFLNPDDIIVFHSPGDATRFLASKKLHNKYLLMIHSPKEPSIETHETLMRTAGDNFFITKVKHLLRHEEKQAIENAEALIAPNKSALDAYYTSDPEMRKLLDRKVIHSVVSGVFKPLPSKSVDEVRKELGVENTHKLIGYFGRYNSDKGYDTYIDLIKNIGTEDVTFISAGIGPIEAPKTNNYTNLGWRTDAIDLINACDYVVAPNKIAYFDLIILEALALGKNVVTSYIGGSKELAEGSVAYLYPGQDSAQQFQRIIQAQSGASKDDILAIYNRHYSMQAFVNGYERLHSTLFFPEKPEIR